MTNAELRLINLINKIPQEGEKHFFLELEDLDKHCYIPRLLPVYDQDIMQFVTSIGGDEFKMDFTKSLPPLYVLTINGFKIRMDIRPSVHASTYAERKEVLELNRYSFPANQSEEVILNSLPDSKLDLFITLDSGCNPIHFLELTPTLVSICSMLFSMIITQNKKSYLSGNLTIRFNHNYDNRYIQDYRSLNHYFQDIKENNSMQYVYPKLLVNPNVKGGELYTKEDLLLNAY